MDYRIYLPESEMPTQWYNVLADLDAPLPPPLHPGTLEPLSPDQLAPIFPEALIEQEISTQRWIDIPTPVLEILRQYRPSPLVRAHRLEQAIGTKAKIYYKNESLSPAGSHKPNTAIAQAYYNKAEGITRLATETGAGQWGTALSFACQMFGMKCTVYMVKVSYEQKPYRGILIRSYGAEVFPSPSDRTNFGRSVLAKDPDCRGSLGVAISEAIEDAASHDDTKYSLGSVLNHVLLHQTITGLEAKKQFAMIGESPDVIIGCVGGGSNFAGMCIPFVPDKLDGKPIRIIGAEPEACPTLTRGQYRYDFGDTAKQTPLMKMHTLGHAFMPAPIHAGGLRYHGNAPILSHLVEMGLVEARAYYQTDVFEAAMLFLRTEGFLPAPETSHAIKTAIDVAKEAEPGTVIAFLYSGHGMLDLAAYDYFLQGKITDYSHPDDQILESLRCCPQVDR